MGNDGGHDTTTTSAYESTTTHPSTTQYGHDTTTAHSTTTYTHPTTTGGHDTTTVPKTTTTYHHDTTTTTHEDTTTTHKPHVTTTTVPKTTTTHEHTTTTHKPTTTTGAGTATTTSHGTTTTTAGSTTTTGGTTTTTRPPGQPSLFSVDEFAFCGPNGTAQISITFGNRPDLNGQTGVLTFILPNGTPVGSQPLVFQSGQTVTVPYPDTTQNVTLVYTLGTEVQTAPVTFPGENCAPTTTTTTAGTTTTTAPGGTTTTTAPGGTTTTTAPGTTTTTLAPLPDTFTFGAAASVCVAEVPTIRITFQNQFPQLAGRTGTLTMSDVNGNVVSVQPLVYQPGATVDILYPGTRVNADGSIADVPGWNLNSDGFWVRDQSDAFLRDGINLSYTVNPTATAFVTYPPESSTCANPSGPFPPGTVPPGTPQLFVPPSIITPGFTPSFVPPTNTTSTPGLPETL